MKAYFLIVINLITRSKKICRMGRRLINCGTIHRAWLTEKSVRFIFWKSFGTKSFAYVGCNFWNRLPYYVRDSRTPTYYSIYSNVSYLALTYFVLSRSGFEPREGCATLYLDDMLRLYSEDCNKTMPFICQAGKKDYVCNQILWMLTVNMKSWLFGFINDIVIAGRLGR